MAKRRSRKQPGGAKGRTRKPARRRGKRAAGGVFDVVRQARSMATKALDTLRKEIRETRSKLDALLESERGFQIELFGGHRAPQGPRVRSAAKPRRKGPPKADKFFARLPQKFTLDDVRKVAGRLSGVSLAQWSRAKKIRKTKDGYVKAGN